MQIYYLFLKERNHIKLQEFNFGGEYIFHYDQIKQTLTVKLNPFFVPGFYSPADAQAGFAEISNVTGIIAENGAGKTTLLNVIRENFAKGSGGVKDPLIITFKHNGLKKICHYGDIPISGGNYADYGFSVVDISPEKQKFLISKKSKQALEYTTPVKIRDFEHVQFVYFSSVFTNNAHVEVGGTIDISTSYLVKHDIIDEIENKRITRNNAFREIDTHFESDISRQITFINVNKNKWQLPIHLPEVLYIRTKREIDAFDITFDEGDISIIKEYGFEKILKYILTRAHREIHQRWADWRIPARIHFAAACIVNYLYELATNFRNVQSHVQFDLDADESADDVPFLEKMVTILREIELQALRFEFEMTESFYTQVSNVQYFIKKLPDFINDDGYVANNTGNSFGINIQERPELFFEFTGVYNKAYNLKPFLGFSWRNMSSGEIAYLNIFSRFYSIIHKELTFENLTNDILILIDEGELYMHPMWQKKFVKLILDFLPELFAKNESTRRNLQIIFTTNSPIPASDLPNSNIIFLEKSGESVIVKNSLEDKKFTLGANINTLLADSFFLKDGTIGDFAKLKINQVIETLQGDYDSIIQNRESLERSIQMIGEPIVKHKLIQMLNERLNLNLINLNQNFVTMSKRLRQLENEMVELRKNQNPK